MRHSKNEKMGYIENQNKSSLYHGILSCHYTQEDTDSFAFAFAFGPLKEYSANKINPLAQ